MAVVRAWNYVSQHVCVRGEREFEQSIMNVLMTIYHVVWFFFVNLLSHQKFNFVLMLFSDDERLPELTNRVYFLKRRLYARLFHTIIGSECVSAQRVIENIFEMYPDDRYCSVSVDGILQNYYRSLSGPLQDNMSHSLMLVIAFVNLVVLNRHQSLQALLSNKN